MNERTLKYAQEQLQELRKLALSGRQHNELKDGDTVRWYLNPHEYITGQVVEVCGDGTVWVEHNNGQQRHYSESELSLDGSQKIQVIK